LRKKRKEPSLKEFQIHYMTRGRGRGGRGKTRNPRTKRKERENSISFTKKKRGAIAIFHWEKKRGRRGTLPGKCKKKKEAEVSPSEKKGPFNPPKKGGKKGNYTV